MMRAVESYSTDRMVKIEIEAAEALAGLAAHSVSSSGGDSRNGSTSNGKRRRRTAGSVAVDTTESLSATASGKWGSKGKRVMARVKTESSPDDSVTSNHPLSSLPKPFDLSLCPGISDYQGTEEIHRNFKLGKCKQTAKVSKPSTVCSTSSMPFGGNRSRKNLTEAEKEARRIRRILANRESARQTIHRRQALYEELTRNVADLSCENTELKTEKELALSKYQSLKRRNELLKSELARNVKSEVEETPEPKITPIEISPSPPTSSLVLYNNTQHSQPQFTQFFLPSVFQSSNPVQQALVTGSFDSSNEHVLPVNINGPRTPVYILPCPWFFPFPCQSSGVSMQPSYGMSEKQDVPLVINQCNSSSSIKSTTVVEKLLSPTQIKVETEECSSTNSRAAYNLSETLFGFPPDGGGLPIEEVHDKGTTFTPPPVSAVRVSTNIKSEDGLQPDSLCREAVSRPLTPFPPKDRESVFLPSKKSENAAEARKRRKELTKLKSLHGRQCRLQCSTFRIL